MSHRIARYPLTASERLALANPAPMTDRIRIIKHEAVPKTGSFEVRFADDRNFLQILLFG